MSYAFISYSRQDSEFTYKLTGELRQRGAEIWIDQRIQAGDHWDQKLEDALSKKIDSLID